VKPLDIMVNNKYSLFQHSVALYIIKTDKAQIVVKKVKQVVFILLNAVHIHPTGWLKLCVVGGMDFVLKYINKHCI